MFRDKRDRNMSWICRWANVVNVIFLFGLLWLHLLCEFTHPFVIIYTSIVQKTLHFPAETDVIPCTLKRSETWKSRTGSQTADDEERAAGRVQFLPLLSLTSSAKIQSGATFQSTLLSALLWRAASLPRPLLTPHFSPIKYYTTWFRRPAAAGGYKLSGSKFRRKRRECGFTRQQAVKKFRVTIS